MERNTTHFKYSGVTLGMTVSYCQHIQNSKMKVATCNNLLKKLSKSKWGTNASTVRNNGTVPVLLNSRICCQSMGVIYIRRHIRPITHPSYGIIPPANIYGRLVFVSGNRASNHQERCLCHNLTKQTDGTRDYHSLFGHIPARSHRKSRKDS